MGNGEGLPIGDSNKSGKLDKRTGDTVRYKRCQGARGVLSNVEGTAAIQKSLDRVPLKLSGEFTSNVTSGAVAGTFAGIAFAAVPSGTRQRSPVITLTGSACAVPRQPRARTAKTTMLSMLFCILIVLPPKVLLSIH